MRLLLLALLAVGLGYCAYKVYTSYEFRQPVSESLHDRQIPRHSHAEERRTRVQEPGIMGMVQSFAHSEGVNPEAFTPQREASPVGVQPQHSFNSSMAIYYAPWQNLEAIDFDEIANESRNPNCSHLDLAMYSFTDWQLAKAIVLFANTGRIVRIYRDREQFEQESNRGNRVAQVFKGNPNILIRVKGSRTLMHMKAWSDGCVLREGSANWSPSGEKQQDNTLSLTTDIKSIQNYEAGFRAIWNRADNEVIQ
jgi:hypothetical protein